MKYLSRFSSLLSKLFFINILFVLIINLSDLNWPLASYFNFLVGFFTSHIDFIYIFVLAYFIFKYDSIQKLLYFISCFFITKFVFLYFNLQLDMFIVLFSLLFTRIFFYIVKTFKLYNRAFFLNIFIKIYYCLYIFF